MTERGGKLLRTGKTLYAKSYSPDPEPKTRTMVAVDMKTFLFLARFSAGSTGEFAHRRMSS